MLCSAILVSTLLAGAASRSADNAGSVDLLTPEVYSLYSTIYRSETGSGEVLAIAAKPLSFPRPLTCLRPRTREEREIVEAARNQVIGQTEWKRQFDFRRAYILIPPAEVSKAIDCIQYPTTKGVPATGCKPYERLHYVWSLSIPIFNKDHTRALVAASRACGGLCGDGGVFVYHKTGGRWELEKDSFAWCRWVS